MLELRLKSATPAPLVDVYLQAISISQWHTIPCHRTFLMAQSVHSHPTLTSTLSPRRMEVQTREEPGKNTHGNSGCQSGHEGQEKQALNTFEFPFFQQAINSVLVYTPVSLSYSLLILSITSWSLSTSQSLQYPKSYLPWHHFQL